MKSIKAKSLAVPILLAIMLLGLSCRQEENQIHGRLDITDHSAQDSELFEIIRKKDSYMFERSYNQLDFDVLEELATDDIEFYHDQSGATYNKVDFINGMRGLANLTYKARRELVEGSTEVFPMYNNGELYAAILMGEHRFYAKEPNEKPEYLTSTARYSTLWILKEGKWKMSRVFSFDHVPAQ